ncbi:MAG: hypothetical protein LIO45_02795, partial [Clostridiales bacterium]|nr:hypothetical protein [Clostridiales bacterium]
MRAQDTAREAAPIPEDDGPELLTDLLSPSHMRRAEPEPEEAPEEPETAAETAENTEEPASAEEIPDDIPLSDSEWDKLSKIASHQEPPRKHSVQEERRVQVLTLNIRKRDGGESKPAADRAFDQDQAEDEPDLRPAPEEQEEDWEQMVIPGLPEEKAELPAEEADENETEPPADEAEQPAEPETELTQPVPTEPAEDPEDGKANEDAEDWAEGVPDESLLEPPERGPGPLQRLAAGTAALGALLKRNWERRREAAEERRRSAQEAKPGGDEEQETEPTRRKQKKKIPDDNVVEMPPPEQPSLFQRKLEEMEERANQFADSMFQSESEEGQEEEAMQRMAERHIPGTDEERAPRKTKKQKK